MTSPLNALSENKTLYFELNKKYICISNDYATRINYNILSTGLLNSDGKRPFISEYGLMALTLDGTSEHVAHAWEDISLFENPIFVTDLIKCHI